MISLPRIRSPPSILELMYVEIIIILLLLPFFDIWPWYVLVLMLLSYMETISPYGKDNHLQQLQTYESLSQQPSTPQLHTDAWTSLNLKIFWPVFPVVEDCRFWRLDFLIFNIDLFLDGAGWNRDWGDTTMRVCLYKCGALASDRMSNGAGCVERYIWRLLFAFYRMEKKNVRTE